MLWDMVVINYKQQMLNLMGHSGSTIYVKYVYSALCCMVDGIDFICCISICINPPYMHMKYLAHVA